MADDFLEEFFSLEGNDPSKENIPPDDNTGVEEVEETEEQEVETTEETEEVPEGDEVISGYIEFLKANELVDIPEEIENISGTPEELQKIFEHTKKSRVEKTVNSIMESLPESFKPLFEYALAGGSSIEEYLRVYGSDNIETLDLEDPNAQRLALREYYQRTTQYSPEKIDRLISYFSDPEDLKTAAEEAVIDLQELRQKEQRELIEQQARTREEQTKAAAQRTIELANSIETSSTIHPQRKNKVKSFFFDPVSVGGQTTTQFNHVIQTILKNPSHQAQLGDILLEYDQDKGFVLDRLEKKVKTKAAQGFRQLIEETLGSKPKVTKSGSTPQNKTSIDWERFLEQ